VLYVADDLHDPTRTGKIFFFAQWMLLVIPVGLFAFFRKWKQPFDRLSLFVPIWFVWIFIRGKFGGIWYDEKFFWLAGFNTLPVFTPISGSRFKLITKVII
jgi:hypothetical protein